MSISLLGYSSRHININVKQQGLGEFRLAGFWGKSNRSKRPKSWRLLKHLATLYEGPWCCFVDFNDLLLHSKKKGRIPHPNSLINGFREAVVTSGLIDIGYEGPEFIWEHHRGSPEWVHERLDRSFFNTDLQELCPGSTVTNLSTTSSDHLPILVELQQ